MQAKTDFSRLLSRSDLYALHCGPDAVCATAISAAYLVRRECILRLLLRPSYFVAFSCVISAVRR